MRWLFCTLIFLILGCVDVSAQEQENENNNSFYAFNFSLYHSEGVLKGENYSFNHLGLDLEKNWDGNKLGLSGWSFGYRKEELDKKYFGHFINFGVFSRIGVVAGFYVKPGIKLEWGLLSDRLDHAVFHEDGSYTYIYLLRNSSIPSEINRGFFLWPVLDIKVGRTVSIFVFEAGLRGGYPEVVVEKYYISENDFRFEIDKNRVLIPSAVATVGLKF